MNNAIFSEVSCFEAYLFPFGQLPTLLRWKLVDFLPVASKVTNFIYFYK